MAKDPKKENKFSFNNDQILIKFQEMQTTPHYRRPSQWTQAITQGKNCDNYTL